MPTKVLARRLDGRRDVPKLAVHLPGGDDAVRLRLHRPDPRSGNCGLCCGVCPAEQTCENGRCVTCRGGKTLCRGDDTDLTNDFNNGEPCGVECPDSHLCHAGRCACAAREVLCGGVCRDVSVDRNNCGA